MPKNVFAGVGISSDGDPYKAGKDAVEKAIEDMRKRGGKDPIFGIVFCSGGKYGRDEKTIKSFVDGAHSVFSQFKDCKWVGCTTGGEISENNVTHGSVVVSVLSSEYIKFGVGVGKNISKNGFNAGKEAVEKAIKDIKLDKEIDAYISYMTTKTKNLSEIVKLKKLVVLTLPAGFTLKSSGWEESMMEGIKSVLGETVPIVGGSAGDDGKFVGTFQFANGQVFSDSVVLTAIFTHLKVGFGLSHGYKPTNKIALITRSKEKIIYELNNRPAAEVYAEMLGISLNELMKGSGLLKFGEKFPRFAMDFIEKIGITKDKFLEKIDMYKFMISSPFGIPDVSGEYWAKVPKGIVEKKYIEFYNNIPEKMPITLMEIDRKKAIEATADALKQSISIMKRPAFSLIFECGGRYFYLGNDVKKSIEAAKKLLKGTPFIGFYTHGEQGLRMNSVSGCHTYSVTTLTISDELVTEKNK